MAYIICCDFDGVLHAYDSGWRGATRVDDNPVPGALEWLDKMAHLPGYEVHIYSSRSKEAGGIDAMRDWLYANLVEFYTYQTTVLRGINAHMSARATLLRLQFPTQKPAAAMTIDDRAFCFEGTFPSLEWLENFKPWNKRS